MNRLKNPFGEVSCEQETEQLGRDYERWYFEHTPFNAACVDPQVYLVVGRRGCGKTSLSRYFSFQDRIRDCRCIDVDEPTIYEDVFARLLAGRHLGTDIGLALFERAWEWTIWTLLFQEYRSYSSEIDAGCPFPQRRIPSELIVDAVGQLATEFELLGDHRLLDAMRAKLRDPVHVAARRATLAIIRKRPVIVAIDSLEHYDVYDDSIMLMIAGLIQCASSFSTHHLRDGIHVKAFVTAEVFPHLQEKVLSNPLKFAQAPVYLNWRPKDLLRLVSWRFHHHLVSNEPDLVPHGLVLADWDKFGSVLDHAWKPYFGDVVTNGLGVEEETFPYILRHTQMRPRQLVVICNAIARRARDEGTFPRFTSEQIVGAVHQAELELATEVLNSYSRIHKNASEIIGALVRAPMRFRGSFLDKRARNSSGAWPGRSYSLEAFRRLVAELGVVGRVRTASEDRRVITADFEYFGRNRLDLQSNDDCVLHPMFFNRLHVSIDDPWTVIPFPDHVGLGELEHDVR
jgi:hypothetical protein